MKLYAEGCKLRARMLPNEQGRCRTEGFLPRYPVHGPAGMVVRLWRPAGPKDLAPRLGGGAFHRRQVSDLMLDPTGDKARARKEALKGKCAECNGPTSIDDSTGKPYPRCRKCSMGEGLMLGLPVLKTHSEVCGFLGCAAPRADRKNRHDKRTCMCDEHFEVMARIKPDDPRSELGRKAKAMREQAEARREAELVELSEVEELPVAA